MEKFTALGAAMAKVASENPGVMTPGIYASMARAQGGMPDGVAMEVNSDSMSDGSFFRQSIPATTQLSKLYHTLSEAQRVGDEDKAEHTQSRIKVYENQLREKSDPRIRRKKARTNQKQEYLNRNDCDPWIHFDEDLNGHGVTLEEMALI